MIMRTDGNEQKPPLRAVRDTEIQKAVKQKEENMVRETIILQKVDRKSTRLNSSH